MRARILVAATSLLVSSAAGAQGLQGNVALLGARASGLGGAAVGLPDDDASAFYNPAAIASDPAVQVSAAASVAQLEHRSLSPYLGSRATEKGFALLPNASVFSAPWRGGRAAFSIFATDGESLVLNQAFAPPPSSGISTANIRRVESSATYQVGPSYGRAVTEKIAVGFSILYLYRTQSLLVNEYAESSDPGASVAALSHNLQTDSVSQGLAFVGGVRVQPTGPRGRFTLGLSVRSGVSLAEQLASRDERFTGTRAADGSLQFTRTPTQGEAAARAGIPASASLGASIRLVHGLGLVSAQATVTSAQADLAPGVAGRLTVDGAAGTEWTIDQGWMVRGGVFTRRSAVADARTAPQIDAYGATLGLSNTGPHHSTDAALVVLGETGSAPVQTLAGGNAQAEVSGYTLLLTLGGAFRF